MKKRWLVVVGVGVVCCGLTAPASLYAAVVDLLAVPATVGLTLNAAPYAAAYTKGTTVQTLGFQIEHNNAAGRAVTANAVKDGANSANNITLTVTIAGQSLGMLVDAGGDVAGNVSLWPNVAEGTYERDLSWTVDGTLALTRAGSYVWTVTFTSTAL